jgi:hypothetical protein
VLNMAARLAESVASCRAQGLTPMRSAHREVVAYAVSVLGESPDDTWSGRRNDARRAYVDGRREAARDLLPYDLFREVD